MDRARRPVVAFDVDGVLADQVLGFTRLAHRMFGTPVFGPGWMPVYPFANERCRLDEGQEAAVWEEIGRSPDFWTGLTSCITPADKAAVWKLFRHFEVVYVTDRFGVDPKGQTFDWLSRQGLPAADLVYLSREHKDGKVGWVRELGAVAALDDSPEVLNVLWSYRVCIVYKRVWQYNQHSPGTPVHSVDEFCHRLLDSGEDAEKRQEDSDDEHQDREHR